MKDIIVEKFNMNGTKQVCYKTLSVNMISFYI